MEILTGEPAGDWDRATTLAIQTAGLDAINQEIIDTFAYFSDTNWLGSEADKAINSTMRSRYGNKATWRADRWFVPVPKLHYDSKDIPRLSIEVFTYLVASIPVRTQRDYFKVTLVGSIGKAYTLDIPLIFLHALLEDDLSRFAVVARDTAYTTWEIPGAKLVHLPNDFVDALSQMLQFHSVVDWLGEFGEQGRCIAPLVAGNLLGLAFQDSHQPVPVNSEGFKTEDLVGALEGMAFRHTEAQDMVNRAAPHLRADMALEEAIRIALQMGKGEA